MDLTVIGLGNPGSRYSSTRHNVGFRVVDVLARQHALSFKKPFLKSYLIAQGRVQGGRLSLVKPLTYMNRSGDIFPEILKRTGSALDEILVVCDTLDLPIGQCRLKRKGSSAGQKGLQSIIGRLGRKDFMRLHIGIGRPRINTEVIRHVLSEPADREAEVLERAVHWAAEGVLQVMQHGLERVMNVFNQRNGQS